MIPAPTAAPPPALFSFLYDQAAFTWIHAALAVFVLAALTHALALGRHKTQAIDVLLVTLVSAVPRVAFAGRSLIRTAHQLINLQYLDDGAFHSYTYPVSFAGLLRAARPLWPGVTSNFDVAIDLILTLGILTPAVFYLLCRTLGADRRLGVTLALLVALNPTHVLFSGNYDFFVPSVFYEVLSHLLLLVFLGSGSAAVLPGFLLASTAFYHCRPENSVIFFLHGACLLYAIARMPLPRWLTAAGLAAFVALNVPYQIDWFLHGTYSVHVVSSLPLSPLRVFTVLFDPDWNHFLDWRWSPPYLIVLMALGLWRMRHERRVIHLYAIGILAVFLLVYHDIACHTTTGNSRYFLNLLPAAGVLCLGALAWLYRLHRAAFPVALGVIALAFVAYVPRLDGFGTIVQDEYAFYRAEVQPRLDRRARVWTLGIEAPDLRALYAGRDDILGVEASERAHRSDVMAKDFMESHLFVLDDFEAVHRDGDLTPGDWVYIGAACYQFSVSAGEIVPACAAQLRDSRNRIVAEAAFQARPYHVLAPWYVSHAWKGFERVRFYLLRRG